MCAFARNVGVARGLVDGEAAEARDANKPQPRPQAAPTPLTRTRDPSKSDDEPAADREHKANNGGIFVVAMKRAGSADAATSRDPDPAR
jgi:hypothetical protein